MAQTLHITKQTTITMQVGSDGSASTVTPNFEGDIVETTEGEDEVVSESIDGGSEVIDSAPTSFSYAALIKVKKDNVLWFRAAYGESTSGTGDGVVQTFVGTGSSQDTDFILQNIITPATGTGAMFKMTLTDANVKISNLSWINKDIAKMNVIIKVSAGNRKLQYREEKLT